MQAQEDAADLHATVPDRCPKGCTLDHCYAISGINSGAWPDEFAAIQRLQQDQRGPAVEKFYYVNFWGTHGDSWYAQLTSDDVVKRVFDFAVNAGSVAAVRCLQTAVTMAEDCSLVVDGKWGSHTVDAVNSDDPDRLIPQFKAMRVAHYEDIARENPADAVYLAAWTARALR
jgi:lysozyme family protein